MRRSAQGSSPRPRTRRKAATPPAPPASPAVTAPPEPAAAPADSVEALFCLALGTLLVVAALVPRSFKQLFLLGFGGALAYRGLEGEGGFRRRALPPASQ